jgi:hypothetical protein
VDHGKDTKDVPKKFNMGEAKTLSTPMSTTTALDDFGTVAILEEIWIAIHPPLNAKFGPSDNSLNHIFNL